MLCDHHVLCSKCPPRRSLADTQVCSRLRKSLAAALSMDFAGGRADQFNSVAVHLQTPEMFVLLAAAYGKTPAFPPNVIIQ